MLHNQSRLYLMEWRRAKAARCIIMLVLLVLLGTMSLAACTFTRETRTDPFLVGSSPDVTVEVGNGDVNLVVGSAGEIVVTAELRSPEKVEYEAFQEGDSVIVRAKTKSDSRADVTLAVPENTRFGVSTGSGDVDAAGIQASGQVHIGSGSVKLEGIRGVVSVGTGSGKITLRDSSGSFTLSAGSGKITVHDSTGAFDLNSGSGGIAFRGELPPGSDNSLTAGSGSVTVELTGTPSVALDLETDDGKVRCDLPVTVSEESQYRLVGNIGDGEAALTVRTGSGDITIK